MRTRNMIGIVAVIALVGASAGAATAAAVRTGRAATPATMRQVLNAERKHNGVPANIAFNETWNKRCKQHDNYMAVNHELTHEEDPDQPGYTKGGAWAGAHSVLEYGSTWANGDPYVQAPIHFAQLMAPSLAHSGGFELDKGGTTWGCTVTIAGAGRALPETNKVFTVPGPGTTGVRPAYHASEGPFTPNDLVHTSNDCGQELFVFLFGPALEAGSDPYGTDITQATLHPAGGANVAVKIADGTVPTPGGGKLGYYLGQGAGIVIPVKPLKAGTTYEANVTVKVNGVAVHHSWEFTTKPAG